MKYENLKIYFNLKRTNRFFLHKYKYLNALFEIISALIDLSVF